MQRFRGEREGGEERERERGRGSRLQVINGPVYGQI
jgi:hypothetical protein